MSRPKFERIDMTGRRCGDWTVLRYEESRKGAAYWRCSCVCGHQAVICGKTLRSSSGACLHARPFREIEVEGRKAIEIPLTRGKATIIDPEDAYLAAWRWRSNSYSYAVRDQLVDGKRATVFMHNLILPSDCGMDVDHINRNPLDNRRANLRLATRGQNNANRSTQRNNTSGFRGVGWWKTRGKWRAIIKVNGRTRTIGVFDDPIAAAKARDSVALDAFGSFAVLNFPSAT